MTSIVANADFTTMSKYEYNQYVFIAAMSNVKAWADLIKTKPLNSSMIGTNSEGNETIGNTISSLLEKYVNENNSASTQKNTIYGTPEEIFRSVQNEIIQDGKVKYPDRDVFDNVLGMLEITADCSAEPAKLELNRSPIITLDEGTSVYDALMKKYTVGDDTTEKKGKILFGNPKVMLIYFNTKGEKTINYQIGDYFHPLFEGLLLTKIKYAYRLLYILTIEDGIIRCNTSWGFHDKYITGECFMIYSYDAQPGMKINIDNMVKSANKVEPDYGAYAYGCMLTREGIIDQRMSNIIAAPKKADAFFKQELETVAKVQQIKNTNGGYAVFIAMLFNVVEYNKKSAKYAMSKLGETIKSFNNTTYTDLTTKPQTKKNLSDLRIAINLMGADNFKANPLYILQTIYENTDEKDITVIIYDKNTDENYLSSAIVIMHNKLTSQIVRVHNNDDKKEKFTVEYIDDQDSDYYKVIVKGLEELPK
jgi:hypothetical protein